VLGLDRRYDWRKRLLQHRRTAGSAARLRSAIIFLKEWGCRRRHSGHHWVVGNGRFRIACWPAGVFQGRAKADMSGDHPDTPPNKHEGS